MFLLIISFIIIFGCSKKNDDSKTSINQSDKNNVAIFNFIPDKEDYKEFVVYPKKLLLRKTPSLNGEVITSLEVETDLILIEKSNIKEEYFGINAEWFKVKTSGGNTGYVYSGFIVPKKYYYNYLKSYFEKKEIFHSITSNYDNSHNAANSVEDYKLTSSEANLFERSGDTLILKLSDGKEKKLINKTEYDKNGNITPNCEAYIYYDFIKEIKSFVVFVQYYESSSFLLINADTGEESYVPGYPLLSPDFKKFVCLDEGGYESGFFVYSMEGFTVENEKILDPIAYPDNPVWIDSNNLILEKCKSEFYNIYAHYGLTDNNNWHQNIESADIDYYLPEKDEYKLHLAIVKEFNSEIDDLLKGKIDINYPAIDGVTPLQLAAEYSKKEIVEKLIEHNADINLKDKYGRSVLHYAVKGNNVDIIDYFLKKGLNINEPDNEGFLPIHFAAKYASPGSGKSTIEFLLENGANVNAVTNQGNTPLFLAIDGYHTWKAKILIKNGADITIKNKENKTAYDYFNDKLKDEKDFIKKSFDDEIQTMKGLLKNN